MPPLSCQKEVRQLNIPIFIENTVCMTIERSGDEILVRLSASIDIKDIQDILDYLSFKEAASHSKANQKDAMELSNAAKSNLWKKIKKDRSL